MKKQYLWKAKVKSQYGVESLVLCKDKAKLIDELKQEKYSAFTIGKVEKSSQHYVTDGNTEIHHKPLHW